MNIWLLQANEPMPIVNDGQRLFRMGLIAEELKKRGHNIKWFATTFNHFEKKQMYKKDTIVNVNDNYEIYLIKAPGYKKNISVKRIINHKYMAVRFRQITKKLEKPDLIYTSFPTIEFAEEAVKYGKKNNIPVIVDIRDLWPDIFNHNLSKFKKIIAFPYIQYMQFKTKKIMKNAYAINGISDPIVDWGVKKAERIRTEKDKSIFMGYDINNKVKEKKVEKFNANKFNICFFGTLNNQFQFEKLVSIAEKLKDAEIDIYVCGLGDKYNYLMEKSKKLQNLKLLGWIGKEELKYVLKNSKIGMAIYRPTFDFQMSTSNKFAEYLSYGLPVVLTSGGYMGRLIEENECGINSNEVEEIVKYIIKLKTNPQEYIKVSLNSESLYQQEFVAKKIYLDLVNYLEKIYMEVKK